MSRTLKVDPATGEIRPNANGTRSTEYEQWANFHGTTNWDTPIVYPDYPGTGNWGDPINDYDQPIGPEAPAGWIMYPGGAGPEAPTDFQWSEPDNISPYNAYMDHVVNNMQEAPNWGNVTWNFPEVPSHPPGGMWGDEIMNLPQAPNNPLPILQDLNPPAVNPNYIDYTNIIPIAPPANTYDGLVPVPPPDRPEGPHAWSNIAIGKS